MGMFDNKPTPPMPQQVQMQALPPLVTYVVTRQQGPNVIVEAHNVSQNDGCLFFTKMVKVNIAGQDALMQISPRIFAAGQWLGVSTDFDGTTIEVARGVLR